MPHKDLEIRKQYMRDYREKNRDALHAKRTIYNATHEIERKVHQARYYSENRSAIRERRRLQYQNNIEKLRATQMAYYAANRECRNAASREYYRINRDERLRLQKEYDINHVQERRAYEKRRLIVRKERYGADENYRTMILGHRHKRRARMEILPRSFSIADWADVLDLFGHKCAYCGKDGKLHQDHFIPVTRGGGYEMGNIVPACHSCNSRKNAKDPLAWLGLRRWLDTLETMYAV